LTHARGRSPDGLVEDQGRLPETESGVSLERRPLASLAEGKRLHWRYDAKAALSAEKDAAKKARPAQSAGTRTRSARARTR
jgi:hypothetical protein